MWFEGRVMQKQARNLGKAKSKAEDEDEDEDEACAIPSSRHLFWYTYHHSRASIS